MAVSSRTLVVVVAALAVLLLVTVAVGLGMVRTAPMTPVSIPSAASA